MSNSVSHVTRQRLGSVGDSAPPSDSSEGSGSETFEIVPDWALDTSSTAASSTHHHPDGGSNGNGLFINADDGEQNLDSMSLENSGILTETERAQVESFFSGLGTEVSSKRRLLCEFYLFVYKIICIWK